MTIQRPETEEEAAAVAFAAGNFEAAVARTDLVERRGPHARTARSKRTLDYRLRGLDLDAPALSEAPTRRARRGHPSLRRRRRRLVVQWTVALIVVAAVAVALRVSVVEPFSVSTPAMVPTLQANTDVLVVKPHFLAGPTKAGSIVVVREPAGFRCASAENASHRIVTRVIGTPGETIWSSRGSIYVDGRRLNEPGWYNAPFGELGGSNIARTTIPAGSYFVMGDNRTNSCDSRSFGPVPSSRVEGRVVATIARNGHPFFHSV